MLIRYIQHRYGKDVAGIEKIDFRLGGLFNYVKGKFLELVVQNIMSRFNNELKEAMARIRENGHFFSGQDEINEIARLYGIGVKVVEFE